MAGRFELAGGIMFRFLTGSLLAVAMAAVLAPVAAEAQATGSYQQSCQNIRQRNGNVITALCPTGDGRMVRTSIDADTCRGRAHDIANMNGQLTCVNVRGNGYGNGYGNGNGNQYGGYNGGAPAGSYAQSCRNISTRNGMLSAECTAGNGAWVGSTIDPNGCRNGDIANMNGRLTCVAGASNGGYYNGAAGLPAGSYQQSCVNATVRGRMLTATCSAANGARITSTLDVARCRPGSDVSNIDGRLECLQYR
jgi:hypothetical protein